MLSEIWVEVEKMMIPHPPLLPLRILILVDLGVNLEGGSILGGMVDLIEGGAGDAAILAGVVAAPIEDTVRLRDVKCTEILGLPVEGAAIGIAHAGKHTGKWNNLILKE